MAYHWNRYTSASLRSSGGISTMASQISRIAAPRPPFLARSSASSWSLGGSSGVLMTDTRTVAIEQTEPRMNEPTTQ